MKETAYNQINPLIRLKEMELLTASQYEQLLKAADMEELRDILRNTVYGEYLKTDFEENFEYIYSKEQGKLFEWLYQMAPEPEIIAIYTSRFTFHNLKVLTKAEVTNQHLDHLFIEDGRYSLSTMKSAVHTKMSSELPEELLSTIREVFDYLQESTLLQAIDVIYDRLFLTFQKQLADKLGYPDIIAEVTAFIDLTNIAVMARGIIQRQTRTFLSTILSSSGSIAKQDHLPYAKESLEAYTSFILSTKYGDMLSSIVNPETHVLDLTAFEKKKDDYLTNLFVKGRVTAFGPLPLLAYLNAKEVEWKNLRLLVVGKKNHFPTERLKERMRIVHGS
ncbi:V-type ATPase subunit [Enterococcus sp. CWB-B31]|uniref:V-type ATPase subunit n=1 Tax=Enterococcus sp. CWB-B31 TaxID=2885159 RepID=UPI002B4BECF8|nr:V-type ATPase subunit [Enterococcus sp. CWB-B31]MCB5955240.1 V-type ATPase subunit [Enterococcus sp. CWB-B31]